MSNTSTTNLFRNQIEKAGLANLYQALAIYYALSIGALRNRYMSRPKEKRSAAISQAFLNAGKLKNSTARIMAWYIAAARAGFAGVCLTNAQLAEIVAEATGCKLSARTVSRSNAELARMGWITIAGLPTGEAQQDSKGAWVTRKVNQIHFTPQTKMLADCTTRNYNSLPTPKRQPTLTGVIQERTNVRSFPEYTLSKIDKERAAARLAVEPPHPPVKCSTDPQRSSSARLGKVEPTCPPVRPTAPHATIEQRPLNTGRQGGRKPQGRRLRSRKPRTWAALRLLFLAQLEKNIDAAKTEAEAAQILKLAKIQTLESFPPLVPTPVDWNKIIFTWGDFDWRQRQRFLRQILIPQLAAAVAGLLPVDRRRLDDPKLTREQRAAAAAEIEIRESCAAWQVSIAAEVSRGKYPPAVKEFSSAHGFTLDTFAKLLNVGTLHPAELDPDTAALFRQLADLMGVD